MMPAGIQVVLIEQIEVVGMFGLEARVAHRDRGRIGGIVLGNVRNQLVGVRTGRGRGHKPGAVPEFLRQGVTQRNAGQHIHIGGIVA